jgi:hypothetical protein
MEVGVGPDTLEQRRGVVVEVDEGAAAPGLDPAGDEGEVLGRRFDSSKRSGWYKKVFAPSRP